MKKSLFSLLLVLVLMVAVSVFAAEATTYAEATGGVTPTGGDIVFDCEHCDEADVTWKAWNGTDPGSTTHADGYTQRHYYVPAGGVTMTQDVQVFNLCLYIPEGVTVTAGQSSTVKPAFRLNAKESEVFAVMGGGTIKASNSGTSPIIANIAATYNDISEVQIHLYDVTIDVTGQTNNTNGRAITLRYPRSAAYIHNATIKGMQNNCNTGGSISLTDGAKVVMYGGKITGGHATQGGNIYMGSTTNAANAAASTFTMYGGIVEHGEATEGGNFYLTGYNSTKKPVLNIGSDDEQYKNLNPMVIAGVATTNDDDIMATGGNIMAKEYSAITMLGGTMTSIDNDGTNHGSAENGVNIALSHAIESTGTSYLTTIVLKGGTISSDVEKEGVAVWVSDASDNKIATKSRARINLGNVTIVNPNRNNYSDIYNKLYAPVFILTGYDETAVIKPAKMYTKTGVKIGETEVKHINTAVVQTTNYTDTGNAILRVGTADSHYDVGDYYLLGGTSGTNVSAVTAAVYNGADLVNCSIDTAAMVSACTDGQYVKLYAPATINLTAPTAVDFNGNAATVTGAANLKGIDSATNDYDETGAAVVTVDDAPVLNTELAMGGSTVRKYLALANEGGTYSFHRYYLSMNEVGLRVNSSKGVNPGLLYGAVFYGDQAVADAINNGGEWGIVFKAGEREEMAQKFTTTFAAGTKNTGKRIHITGMLENETDANASILGWAYIKINGETIKCSNAADKTMEDVITAAYGQYSENYAELGDAQRAALETLNTNYGANIKTWWDLELAAQA